MPDTRGKTTASEFEVKEGSVLKSGDHFNIRLISNKDAYLYVLLYDSSGEITALFSDNKVSAGKTIVIANSEDGSELMLDDTVGDETLYFLTSDLPIEDF
ncbi:MAG: DUF4384 domain-containing protein [Desulfobacteraceae bacterium]|nr:DUF4384 domain-containing protein [Desulfobacteraceae bacterium]